GAQRAPRLPTPDPGGRGAGPGGSGGPSRPNRPGKKVVRGRRRASTPLAIAPIPARIRNSRPGALPPAGPPPGKECRRYNRRRAVERAGGSSVDLDKREEFEAKLAAAPLDPGLDRADRAIQQGGDLFLLQSFDVM